MEDRDRVIEGFLRRVDTQAAQQAGAMGPRALRLMPGEDLRTSEPADIQLWAEIYSELERFTEDMLERLAQAGTEAPDRLALDYTEDERQLQAERERMRVHRRYWEERWRLAS